MVRPTGNRGQGTLAIRSLMRPAEHCPANAPHYRSQDLFGQAREVVIEHKERTYRLRLTAQGKPILIA